AVTARSVAAVFSRLRDSDRYDLDRYATALAPAMESVDHRTLGTWSARGAESFLHHYRSLFEVADGVAMREDDILGLRSDALLVRRTASGTDRSGGGAYERQFLALWVFGSDGRIARVEQFDADADAAALARFDELVLSPVEGLTAEPATVSAARRRVPSNAATANAARMETAIVARDADAFDSIFADTYEVIHHLTGTEYGREGALATWRSALKARDLTYRLEPLAILGTSLALCRQSLSASGTAGVKFDVGAFEREEILLIEVDEHGRRRRSEWFATNRLGDAVVRLYERYAELCPEGRARDRATVTARLFQAFVGPLDVDRFAAAFAPALEFRDHRSMGLGPLPGREAL